MINPSSGSCCFDDTGSPSLKVREALDRIESAIQPVTGIVQVTLRHALDRVVAENILAPINVPSSTNSAMDGYALKCEDLKLDSDRIFKVVGQAMAGRSYKGSVTHGECVRIMTGAVVPAGADTVIMQEDAILKGESVSFNFVPRSGQHVRQKGEDLRTGDIAVAQGKLITPTDLGVLASIGLSEIKVYRKPRVAFFSTGDELRSVGQVLNKGDVYDSNRYTLFGMLSRMGVDFLDLGVIRDNREETRQALRDAAANADMVVTSAGVSVGEADFIKEILEEIGAVDFWKIAMKPGRPLAFGNINNALFFGLPGNPVAVMVAFYHFVAPALRCLMGQSSYRNLQFQVPSATAIRKRRGRTEFQRGIVEYDDRGVGSVKPTGSQGSGILNSMSRANCFIVLGDECGDVETGDLVDIEPFNGIV